MDEAEFDQHAEAYERQLRENVAITGEGPEYFAEYKIADVRKLCAASDLQPKRILDFGAGIGASTPYFQQYFPDSEIVSADVSPKSLEILANRYPEISRPLLIEGDTLPLADDSIDLAFTACVFHHIDEAEHLRWLSELKRVVRPGGMFVLFEHNPWNPLTMRAVNTCPFDENAVLITAPEMVRRFRAAGWGSASAKYRLFFPSALSALRVTENFIGWLPLGGQYYVVGRA